MSHGETDEVIEERFGSLLPRYQIRLETSMKGSDSTFDCANLLYYNCHKTNFNRGGSYIDSPNYIKNKKSRINPINNMVVNVSNVAISTNIALNPEEIGKNLHKISKTIPFINRYDKERIHYPLEKDDLKKFEQNSLTTAFNVLYAKKDKMYLTQVSENNSKREKEVALLMIPNGEI